jgi:hypothetical protein
MRAEWGIERGRDSVFPPLLMQFLAGTPAPVETANLTRPEQKITYNMNINE